MLAYFSFDIFPGMAVPLLIAICLFILPIVFIIKNRAESGKFLEGTFAPKTIIGLIMTAIIWSVMCVYEIFDKNGTYLSMMSKTKNIVNILEYGKIIEVNVTAARYSPGAPAGWRVDYSFTAKDPSTGNEKSFWGWSKGPKNYYVNLTKNDTVHVIYGPCDPRKNCEIRSFLNNPSHRYDFKDAGKLSLLEKYKDKYELEDYTFDQWSAQQQGK